MIEEKSFKTPARCTPNFQKAFTTWFFPVGEEVRQIVVDWVTFLTVRNCLARQSPVSATQGHTGGRPLFQAGGLSRSHWSNATPIRAVFKEAFTSAGLPYSNPHSFRKTLTQLGERICHTPEQFKAWSQNLGHETVLTTFSSYGEIARERQAELIRQLGQAKSQTTYSMDALDALLRFVQEQRGEV